MSELGTFHLIECNYFAEVARLSAALKVCEEALHHRSILRERMSGAAEDLIHAAQQASGAYCSDWKPGGEDRDEEATS